MSSPQHPTGSGAQPWHDPHAPNPGPNTQHPGTGGRPSGAAPGPAQGSGPAGPSYAAGSPYGSGPSAPGPASPGAGGPGAAGPTAYGSAPGGPLQWQGGPGPYGSAPGGPGPYGSGPGGPAPHAPGSQGPSPYGSGPHGASPYGSGAYGSGPQGFAPPQPSSRRRTGSGLLGPLTLRDLLLLFAGLLSLIVLFVPYKTFGLGSMSLWSWNVDMMGTLVFNVLVIWLIVAAVLVNKLGSGSQRVGSLSLDQTISVLSGAAFAFAFLQLVTSVQYWHVGAYLAFFAALIAFFAGVFTMLPFFSREFTSRQDIPAHPKARPVSKNAATPAPRAPMPGATNAAGGFGAPMAGAAYGSQQSGFGQTGGPGGQPGGPYAQPGGQSGGPVGHPGGPGQLGGSAPAQSYGQPVGSQQQYGQSVGSQQQYGRPEQQMHESQSFAPPQDDEAGAGSRSHDVQSPPVQSTGGGQTYLGAHDADDPQHSQSEPTQTVGLGARSGEDPVAADGVESESAAERRRGRHAAPAADSDAGDSAGHRSGGSPTGAGSGSAPADAAPAGAANLEQTLIDAPAVSAASNADGESGDDRGSSESPAQEADARSERTTPPESDEPTQYVPMGDYGSSDDSSPRRPAAQTSEQETVKQPAVARTDQQTGTDQQRDTGRRERDGGSPGTGDGRQQIIQAFWFAVPEPREAVDATTGMPVFTIYPGDWFLGLEDHGSWFKVRDSDGREGLLRNTEGIQRG